MMDGMLNDKAVMSLDEKIQLHLYCICGQKMRISEAMLGRPGKCVACRQKIRIPTLDELPPDTDAVYLKDHPEFLRGPRKPPKAPPAEEERYEDLEEEEDEAEPVVALDVLEPLRALASVEYRIAHKLSVLKQTGEEDLRIPFTAKQLEGYLARVRQAREELDKTLHQRLMEVAMELASAQEKIADLSVSARVGEIDFLSFRDQAERLRRHRDCLERRQANLQGWLAVRGPFEAGGYVRMPLDHLPSDGSRLVFENEPEGTSPLLDWWVQGLRDAMVRREQADRRIRELDRLEKEGRRAPPDSEHRRADALSDRKRAAANVAFCQDRLRQIERDYRGDQQILSSQLELLRGRLQVGEIGRSQFDSQEKGLLRIKTELMRADEVVRRALRARTAQDIPRRRETYLRQAAKARLVAKPGRNAWLIWGMALLILISLVLPSLGSRSALGAWWSLGDRSPFAHWLLTLPCLIVLVLAAAAFLPSAAVRGAAVLAVWFLGWLALAIFVHESAYSRGPIGALLRHPGFWLLRPGFFALSLALLGLLIAAVVDLLPDPRARVLLPIGVVALLVSLTAVFTNFFGLFVPRPVVSEIAHATVLDVPDVFDSRVVLGNRGRRTLLLSSNLALPNAVDCILEQQIGQDSWRDVEGPTRIEVAGTQVPVAADRIPDIPVPPGASAVFHYRLGPGTYRIALGERVVRNFSLEAPAAAEQPAPIEETAVIPAVQETEAPISAEPSPPVADASPLGPVQVELRGRVAAEDRAPRFIIAVIPPEGPMRTRTAVLGSQIEGKWRLAEYNPEQETVTLTDGEHLLILRRGERHPLEP